MKLCGCPYFGIKGPKWAQNEGFCIFSIKNHQNLLVLQTITESENVGALYGNYLLKGTTNWGAVAQFFTSDDPSSLSVSLSYFLHLLAFLVS